MRLNLSRSGTGRRGWMGMAGTVLLPLACGAADLAAQRVEGTLRDADTQAAISGARLSRPAAPDAPSPRRRRWVGVEVYYGMATPARYMLDAGGCGVILFWTR